MTKRTEKPKPPKMTKEEFVEALECLGLTIASHRTAERLGVTRRASQFWAMGERPIPHTVKRLLEEMMLNQALRRHLEEELEEIE